MRDLTPQQLREITALLRVGGNITAIMLCTEWLKCGLKQALLTVKEIQDTIDGPQ